MAIKFDQKIVDQITQIAENKEELTISLQDQQVIFEDNSYISFGIDSFRKKCLLEGLDDIGLTLQKETKINSYEERLQQSHPWLL